MPNTKAYCIIDRGALKVFAKTDHVADICRMQDLGSLDLDREININLYVGAHQWLFSSLPKDAINIGIQTEQFFDQHGKKLWGWRPNFFSYLLLNKFDYLIDYSEFNSPAYGILRNSQRIFWGPYIFPRENKRYAISKQEELIFVGDTSGRRSKILDELCKSSDVNSINNQFYSDISTRLNESSGLVNVHNEDAIYTEWPRFLMAYVSGKVLFSEPLGAPLLEGQHYLSLSKLNGTPEELRKAIYDRVSSEIAARFRISDLLSETNFLKQLGSVNNLISILLLGLWSLRMLGVRLRKDAR